MKRARVIVTFKCPRHCAGCINTFGSIKSKAIPLYGISDFLTKLKDYDDVSLSGGEPMLFPDRIIILSKLLRQANPKVKVFMYTAKHMSNADLEHVLPYLDGVQFSLHAEATPQDIAEFQEFQAVASKYRGRVSFRLWVDKDMKEEPHIIPSVWSRIESKHKSSEADVAASPTGGLGAGEELFVLRQAKDQS